MNLTREERNIHLITQFIQEYVTQQWQIVFETNLEKLVDSYRRIGDEAYGVYTNLLFKPAQEQLKQAGIRVSPALPGNFSVSREWGSEKENDRQRWFWTTLSATETGVLGTVVTIFFHDHTQLRIPKPPQLFALTVAGKEAVVKELSSVSDNFMKAKEAKVEIEEYFRMLR